MRQLQVQLHLLRVQVAGLQHVSMIAIPVTLMC